MFKKVFYSRVMSLMFMLVLIISCSESDNTGILDQNSLIFEQKNLSVNEGETLKIGLKINDNGVEKMYDNIANPLNIKWSISENKIATINNEGLVKGLNPGVATLTVSTGDGKHTLSSEITVLNSVLTNKILKPLNNDLIYSKGVYLVRNSVLQSFDVDKNGSIYYVQVGGALKHVLFVANGEPNKDITSSMQLKYFGHGTNMAIEENGEDRFIWIGSNGHKNSSGDYGSNQTFSRIKYVPNKIVERYEEGDTYYMSKKANIHPAIDQEKDILAVTTSGGGNPNRFFYIFKLSEVKNLPSSIVKLPSLTFGGEEPHGQQEQTVEQSINVKDLTNLTPISTFTVAPSNNKTQLNSYAFQGFDISDGKLYFYEGEGNDNKIENGPSNAYLTIFDYMEGKVVSERAKVNAISNIADLNKFNITATGYMEAEGIKMKNGILYLGFASRSTDDIRRANILQYR